MMMADDMAMDKMEDKMEDKKSAGSKKSDGTQVLSQRSTL